MVENIKYANKYNFAFIDEATKKEVRRKLLKAVAIPGHQVPYSSPEMPISRGWGTGMGLGSGTESLSPSHGSANQWSRWTG